MATNYHVIERAKQLTVSFPADKDEKQYAVEGFVAVLPGKDLALIKIRPGDKKLQCLKVAENCQRRVRGCTPLDAGRA